MAHSHKISILTPGKKISYKQIAGPWRKLDTRSEGFHWNTHSVQDLDDRSVFFQMLDNQSKRKSSVSFHTNQTSSSPIMKRPPDREPPQSVPDAINIM